MNTNTLVDNIKKLQMLEKEMYGQLEMLHNKSCITTSSSQELQEESGENLRCTQKQILPFEGKLTSNVDSVNDCLLRCKNDEECKAFSFYTNAYPGRCMLCKTNVNESMDSGYKSLDWVKTRTFNKLDKDNNKIDDKCSQDTLKQQNEILNKIRQLSEVRLKLI